MIKSRPSAWPPYGGFELRGQICPYTPCTYVLAASLGRYYRSLGFPLAGWALTTSENSHIAKTGPSLIVARTPGAPLPVAITRVCRLLRKHPRKQILNYPALATGGVAGWWWVKNYPWALLEFEKLRIGTVW